jgi:hypothetical protein
MLRNKHSAWRRHFGCMPAARWGAYRGYVAHFTAQQAVKRPSQAQHLFLSVALASGFRCQQAPCPAAHPEQGGLLCLQFHFPARRCLEEAAPCGCGRRLLPGKCRPGQKQDMDFSPLQARLHNLRDRKSQRGFI